jgi:alpha-1,6-mannosyltransferase
VSLAALVAGGVALAVAGGRRRLAHGVPVWVLGPLAGQGLHLTTARQHLVIAGMVAAYAAVVAGVRALRATWVVGAIIVLYVALALGPPLLSSDIYNYVDFGRLGAVHHLDPYVFPPASAPHDPLLRFTSAHRETSSYGPAFTLISYALALLGPAGALWSLKALAALAALGCVALVWWCARRLGRPPLEAIVLFGLNPLLLVWTLGGGHNDLLMLFAVLVGVAFVLAGREASAGVALVAALAIKATGGIAIPFAAMGAPRRGRLIAGAVAASIVVIALSAVAFPGHATVVVDVLRSRADLVSAHNLPGEVGRLLGLGGATPRVRLAADALLVTTIAGLLVWVARGGDWMRACGWASVAVVATASWFMPWYAVWPLPFAALTRDRRLLAATFALQAYELFYRLR